MASLVSLHAGFTLLLGILLSSNLNSAQQYCDYKLGRKFHDTNGCTYLEHCSGAYNHLTGGCTNQRDCEKGWMGPGCQYANMVSYTLNKDVVFDGKMSTHRPISEATVNLNGTFIVSAINIYPADQHAQLTSIRIRDKNNSFHYQDRFPQAKPTIYFSRSFMTDQLLIHFGREVDIKEIEVFGGKNIALWKETSQSSVYSQDNFQFNSDRAVDGNGAGDFDLNKTCTHTNPYYANPTWKLQLEKAYSIIAIKIKNRMDSNQHRIDGFKLFATTSQGSKISVYSDSHPHSAVRESILIDSSVMPNIPVNGIIIEGRNSGDKILTLCEVYVYACRPVNDGSENCINFCPENCQEGQACNSGDFTCLFCKEGWEGAYCNKRTECRMQTPTTLPNNLQISPNKSTYAYKDTITFTCTTGFILHGDVTKQCMQSTDFNHDLPTCSAITCPRPLVSDPLYISSDTNKNQYMFKESITFNCKAGFILQGPAMKYCQHNGHFEQDLPSCKAIQCQRRNILPKHLQILPDKQTYMYKERINFSCSTGFNLQGVMSKQCFKPTDFHQFPTCSAITCLRPTVQDPLYISADTNKKQYMFNESITFSCKAGYNLQGTKMKYCQNNTDFEHDLPSCSAITCLRPAVQDPLYISAETNKKQYMFNEFITFSCKAGYNLQGPKKKYCHTNTDFEHDLPNCTAVQCNSSSLQSDHMSIDPPREFYGYKTNLSFSCKEGFNLVGPPSAICGDNNSFVFNTTGVPKCEAVQCSLSSYRQKEQLLILSDKNIRTYGYNSTVMFDCKKGFNLRGSHLGVCGQNNSFELMEGSPFCEAVQCKLPDFQDKLIYDVDNRTFYKYKERIALQCKSGYETKENLTGVCDDKNKVLFAFSVESITCTAVSEEAESLAGPIGGTVGGLLVVIVLIVIAVVLFQRRRRAKDTSSKDTEFTLDKIDHQYAEINTGRKNKNQNDKRDKLNKQETVYYNLNSADADKAKLARQEVYYEFSPTSAPTQTAVSVSELKNYVERKRREDGFFAEQFKKFYTGLQFPATAAVMPGNRSKNKYRNIYPYDETRVLLKSGRGQSDFINASFINGYGNLKSYIAAQGPLANTVDDFWWMIWNERCGKIVMLTNLIEDDKVKCIQYWPEIDKMKTGDMVLEVVDIESFADFIIRTFSLENNKEKRIIRQFHFTAWPDKGVPLYASSLVHFHSKVIHTGNQGKGPLVVHCSAGIGRTGTFIALDILTHQAKESGFVDVFGCVETLRRQRVNMVQTLEQYVFVHDTLIEALMCTSSDPSTAEFPNIHQDLLTIDPESRKRNIDLYFEDIGAALSLPPESAYSLAKDPVNKSKNRYSNILPVDTEMPQLKDEDNKLIYINAVFLPGYKTKRSFIVTQMPLKQTVDDFWRLLFDQKVSTIVMLNDTEQEKLTGKQNIGIYWPDPDKTHVFGTYHVTTQNLEEKEKDFTIIDLLCYRQEEENETEARTIRVYKCNFWPDCKTIPNSVLKFLKLINAVELHNDRNNTGPVVVQCMNGAEKSGLFCVLQVVLERMKIEQDVAIHQVIQQMRSVRPSIIPNVVQLKFCYDAVMEFLNQFDAYSNFQ